MDFAFGEEQELLRATTRRFLTERQSRADVRRVMEGPDTFDPECWRTGAELGWTALLIPESYGGGSVTTQPVVDAVAIAEELGRELNPGPFVPTNVVADALARFGSEEAATTHLPGLASGDTTGVWCLSGDGSPDRSAVSIEAKAQDGGWVLRGTSRYVQGMRREALLLVVAVGPDGRLRHVVVPGSASGLGWRMLGGLDLTRRFAEVAFEDVFVAGDQVLGESPASAVGEDEGDDILRHCLSLAVVLQAAESVGAAEALFGATVEYLKRREQFGRTIASFQAIKHRVADLQMSLEAMRVAAEYAALAWGDQLEDADLAVATAGAYVDDTFAFLASEALQLHGGIGFTWEHDVHLFQRRAKVNQVLYGDGAWHRDRLVALTEPLVPAPRSA